MEVGKGVGVAGRFDRLKGIGMNSDGYLTIVTTLEVDSLRPSQRH